MKFRKKCGITTIDSISFLLIGSLVVIYIYITIASKEITILNQKLIIILVFRSSTDE